MSSGGLGIPKVEAISKRALAWIDATSCREFGRLELRDIAREIGPGQPGRQELVRPALGLAKLEPDGEPIG